ncbi:hypothetical protein BV25DRAFT_711666 [Artomyces pyxidatus]|uniref:Uncharacterized protein n=1 Tax=Artomyces pyxidatus TaxID=48021 RepID=A0ACB8T0B7_9AGAM|nr:hypothetical protein BV25DRAFT_711666 [Artomyces pyxidatus]
MSSLSSAALSNVGGSNQHSATTTVSSIVSSSSLVPSVTGIPTPSVQHRTNEKLIIIIVSCVGGFVVVLVTVLLVVPFSRRYFARRRSRQLDGSSSQHSSARSHQRSISGPDIGAFRKSFSSSISSHSSLPPMQHYPSFNAASPSRSRSPETFYSMSTGSLTSSTTPAQGHSAPMSVVSEYGEVAPPPARLKPAGGMERVPQQVQPAMHHPASRQASFANGHVSASLAGWRLSDYPTNASASTMSVYTDARSRLASDDSEGEGVDETMRRR